MGGYPRGWVGTLLISWCMWCTYPPPPEQNDRYLWKNYLPATSLACGNNSFICISSTSITWLKLRFSFVRIIISVGDPHRKKLGTRFQWTKMSLMGFGQNERHTDTTSWIRVPLLLCCRLIVSQSDEGSIFCCVLIKHEWFVNTAISRFDTFWSLFLNQNNTITTVSYLFLLIISRKLIWSFWKILQVI